MTPAQPTPAADQMIKPDAPQGPAQYYAHSGQHHIITLVLHSYHVVVYREEAENYDRGSGSMGRTYCSGDI